MAGTQRVVYLGPEDFRVFEWRGKEGKDEGNTFTFVKDEPQAVPTELAEHLMEMNPRGCTIETARDYGAQIFVYADDIPSD